MESHEVYIEGQRLDRGPGRPAEDSWGYSFPIVVRDRTARGLPKREIVPSSGTRIPASSFKNVLFPDPLGPMTPTIWPPEIATLNRWNTGRSRCPDRGE